VVTDDTFNAMSVACQSAKLAKEIGIEKIHLVFNRTVKGSEKSERIDAMLETPKEKLFDSITYLPFEELVARYEPDMSKLAASEESLFCGGSKKTYGTAHILRFNYTRRFL